MAKLRSKMSSEKRRSSPAEAISSASGAPVIARSAPCVWTGSAPGRSHRASSVIAVSPLSLLHSDRSISTALDWRL